MKTKKTTKKSTAVANCDVITPEVLSPTWQNAKEFTPALIPLRDVSPSLNPIGRVLYYHQLTMEAGKASISAALMAALELYNLKSQHPNDWTEWCRANFANNSLGFSYETANRYLKTLSNTIGKGSNLYLLSHDSHEAKLAAVAQYTKYTNYQSLYQIYRGEGIVSTSKLGGKREGAGRKKKDAAAEERAELDAAANSPALLIAAIREPISAVYKAWRERDVFARIELKDLSLVAASLNELSVAATSALKSRSK